jgi:Flp pilus assembly pilin Flp
MSALRRFLSRDEATTTVEYAVMLAFILMSCIAAIGSLGSQSGGMWGNTRNQLQAHGF